MKGKDSIGGLSDDNYLVSNISNNSNNTNINDTNDININSHSNSILNSNNTVVSANANSEAEVYFIKEGKGSAGVFIFQGRIFPFHRPHPQKEAKKYQIDDLRKF